MHVIRVLGVAVLAAAFGLLAEAAGAAPHATSEQPDGPTIVAAHRFAACVADESPREAERALAIDPGSGAYGRAVQGMASGHEACTTGKHLQFDDMLLAGGMAEHLLQARAGSAPLAPLFAYDPAAPLLRARDETDLTALCTIRKDPDAVAALFATEPASEAEDRAERAIGPSLVACVKAGQTIRLNRPALRAMLALAGWRIVAERVGGRR
jgi:hypothetical protein